MEANIIILPGVFPLTHGKSYSRVHTQFLFDRTSSRRRPSRAGLHFIDFGRRFDMISVFRGCSNGNSRSNFARRTTYMPNARLFNHSNSSDSSTVRGFLVVYAHVSRCVERRLSGELEGKRAFSSCSSMVRDLVDSPCGFVLTYGRSTVSLYISHFSLRLCEAALVSNVHHSISEG